MGGHTGTLKFNGMATYSSSKAAMACITECIAEEIKTKGASANCLNIGAVNTEMMKTAFPDFETHITPEIMARFIINFTIFSKELFNGKVIPVSSTIP
jgi:NAD(P)-dependent dehydrogenase (short-subunit alcohol dehydrogenase family)